MHTPSNGANGAAPVRPCPLPVETASAYAAALRRMAADLEAGRACPAGLSVLASDILDAAELAERDLVHRERIAAANAVVGMLSTVGLPVALSAAVAARWRADAA